MAIRSKGFVGIAEGIKSHELSTKGRIESLRGTISELSGAKRSLESQISYLEAALAAAYEDTDEDGDPDYGRISAIEAQISQAEGQLSEVEGELDDAHGELTKSEAELDGVMEEKARTLFEIQERARKTSNNIAVAGGMYGAYSGVGSSLQSSMQTSLASLSQAASILDGSVDGFTGGGSGGGGGGSSTGGRGMTSQGELSTSALSAFAVGAATSSILSGNTSPASAPSSFTTNHTNGATPATMSGFRSGQQSINPQRTLNFNTDQGENSYATTSFSKSDESKLSAQSENYHSSQVSPSMEGRFTVKSGADKTNGNNSAGGEIERRRAWAQQYKVDFTPTVSSPSSTTNSGGTSAPNKGQREIADELERGFVLGALASKFAKGRTASQSAPPATSPKSSEEIRKDFIQRLQANVEPVIRTVNTNASSSDNDDVSIGARVREKRNDRGLERGLLSKFGLGFITSQVSSVSDADSPTKPRNQILAGKVESHNQATKEPRSLTHTAEVWTRGAGNTLTYNTPIETGKKLDYRQGKVENFQGTCGLVSCVNVLRMAGVPATEADVVKYASTTFEENTNSFVASLRRKTLCTTNAVPSMNGGTSAASRKKILEHFGIPSRTAPQSIETIAQAVASGHGVIASVHAETLYFKRRPIHNDLHAITITSVQRDTTGKILGFYVCDSNAYALGGTGATYYTAEEIEEALSERECNITTTIIR